MEVLQWASSAARRRVAWVYEGTYLYSPFREVYIGSPPLGFTYLNRFGYSFNSRLTQSDWAYLLAWAFSFQSLGTLLGFNPLAVLQAHSPALGPVGNALLGIPQ